MNETNPTPKVRSKRRVVDLDEVMRLAAQGNGTSKICSAMKLDISTLMDRLRSSGKYEEYKEINSRNSKIRPKRRVVDIDRVMDLARKNNSMLRICQVLGIDKETLRDRLITSGRLEEFDSIIAHRTDCIDACVEEAIRIAPACRSVREAADRIGCDQSTLNNRLITRGRLEEFQNKKLRVTRTKLDIEEAFKIAGEYNSASVVNRELNTTADTLYRLLEEAGRYDEFIGSIKPRQKTVNVTHKNVKKSVENEDVPPITLPQITDEEQPASATIDMEYVMDCAARGMTIKEVAAHYDIGSDILRKHLLDGGKLKEYVEISRSVRFQEAPT